MNKSKEASEGQDKGYRSYLFTPESIKDTFSASAPEWRRRVAFKSVSAKQTWKYTELAVIICEGLFTFKGNVEGKKRQTDTDLDEGPVCVSDRAG